MKGASEGEAEGGEGGASKVRMKGERGGGGAGEIVPTTTETPIPQPEALYCSQKLDPTTTGQLCAQNGPLLQLERSSLFSIGLCE